MLETKEQKQIVITCGVLVLILAIVSACSRPDFRYEENVPNQNVSSQTFDSQAYLAYLNGIQTDPAASKELFQQILSADDIKKAVEEELQTGQVITVPAVDQKKLQIVAVSGAEAITQYLTDSVGPVVEFNQKTQELNKSLFDGNAEIPDGIRSEFEDLKGTLERVAVPGEAAALHTALLASFYSYGDLLSVASAYNSGAEQDPWPDVYRDYAAINKAAASYGENFDKLEAKYKLASLPPLYYAAAGEGGFSMAPKAQALFGFGDFSITVGDIPRIIMDAVKEGLVSSFSKFMGSFLDKMIAKIESNYVIANFLYYSDALVAGQYADDYLNKYVSDSLDRKVIKQFIPQFSCGQQPSDLSAFFKAKAQTYLGFDPTSVDSSDPQYYIKLSRVGDFLSSPQGWQAHYEDLAAQAQAEAEKSVEQELTSSGLKTPRDTVGKAISNSINSITSAEKAAFEGVIQLGISNASSIVSSVVASLTENLVNKFVFRGAVSSNGGIGVIKEQSTCLAAAQFQVVLPTDPTQYETPAPAPDEGDLIEQECAKLPRGCDYGATSSPDTQP